MNSQDIFQLNQLRSQIAMQEILQKVDLPPARQEVAICPHCQGKAAKKPRLNQQIFLCVPCRQKFQQQLPIHCDCSRLGSIPLCQYCPHFQQVLAKVKKRVDELRPLGYTELKQIESQVSGDKLHSEMP